MLYQELFCDKTPHNISSVVLFSCVAQGGKQYVHIKTID